MIKILIADDHPIVREGLKQILSDASDITVVDEASNGQELLERIPDIQIDVVLLDITMPGINGIDALKNIKSLRPKLPVLMLSVHPEEQYAIRFLKAGASGYLTKSSAPDELVNAIRKVYGGSKYISSTLAVRLADELNSDSDKQPHETLSDREYQVLCLISTGHTVTQIAEQLNLSVKTISTYRSRILEKMRMQNNAELTYYSIQNKLVE